MVAPEPDQGASAYPARARHRSTQQIRPHPVCDYRTQDGLADYGFSIEFQPDIGWRVYIVFQPYPQGRDDSLESSYQSIDSDGRRYVNWPSRLDSLGDAKTIAALWAELAQHPRIQKQHAPHGDLIKLYQRTQDQKKVTSPDLEHLGDGTIVQRISFGEDDFAVLDVSLDVSTINWTTRLSPGRFISEIDQIADLAETDPVFLQMSPSEVYESRCRPCVV
jgi:hypothetical protein